MFRYPIANALLYCGLLLGSSLLPGALSYADDGPVLSAGVQTTLVLPSGMYGQWQVTASLLETGRPELFPPIVNDIWILEQLGTTVRLTNPSTRASSTIYVDEVEGDSAAFHHVSESRREIFTERPRITLINDKLLGYTLIQRQQRRPDGSLGATYVARYRLEAYRLSQAPVRADSSQSALSSSSSALGEPDITISPIIQGN